jgi:hypothetical protein
LGGERREAARAFLSALHRFPAEEAEELGLPHADRDVDGLRALRDEVLPPLWYEHLLVDRPSGRLLAVVDWEARRAR